MTSKKPPKFNALEIYKSGLGSSWYWRLTAKNGRVIADGSEGYSSEAKARQGFKAAAKLAAQSLATMGNKNASSR